MKVLQINSVCGTGSTGRIAVDIATMLEKNGHECLIAYGRGDAPINVNSIKIGSALGVRLHGFMNRITDRHGFYSKRATEKFIAQMENFFMPDIVQLHNIHGYYLHLPTLFAWLKKIDKPIVWTLHDCWAFTGHCAHYDAVNCGKWQEGCFNCPQKDTYPASKVFDASRKNYAQKKELFTSLSNITLLTPSKWLATQVDKSFLQKYPIKVVPNGVDLEVFKPTTSDFREKNNLQQKKIVLGVSNGWNANKGLKDFITLSKTLPKDYQIVLVGIDKKNKLPTNIIGIERTNNTQELTAIYSAADVYVNTSVEETMGLTTVEAMACGTPAVVYNATAIPEVIEDGCGIVVPKGDISGLHKAIEEVAQTAAMHGSACIKQAARYEKNESYKKYLEIYQDKVTDMED